jgi:hypothetical protein
MTTPHTADSRSPRQTGRAARSALLLTASMVVALSLTGCTVSFQPAGTEPSPSTPASGSDQPSDVSVDPDDDAGSNPDEGSGEGDTPQATREHWKPRVSRIVSCVDGRADITADATALEVASDCDVVTIAGAGVIVLAQKVGALTVTADASTVIVAEADTIEVSGVGNDVRWESGEPTVSDTGTMNVVLPAERN